MIEDGVVSVEDVDKFAREARTEDVRYRSYSTERSERHRRQRRSPKINCSKPLPLRRALPNAARYGSTRRSRRENRKSGLRLVRERRRSFQTDGSAAKLERLWVALEDDE